MANIHDLPIELLALIMDILYMNSTRKYSLTGVRYWVDNDLSDPSTFPCSAANVCQLWRHIMAAVPHYWTQFALDLALKEPLPLDALLWSKVLPFKVLIFDSRLQFSDAQDNAYGLSKEQEQIAVEAITKALQPHLQRCEALSYDVRYPSSIPTLVFALLHCSKKLERLELDFLHDDREPLLQGYGPRFPLLNSFPWSFPELERLSIDAKTFMTAASQFSLRWYDLIASATSVAGLTLEISRHTFLGETDDGPNARSLSQFFHYLAELPLVNILTLRDLSADPCATNSNLVTLKQPLAAVHFEGTNLSRNFLSAFFKAFDLPEDEATFVGCAFPSNSSMESSWGLTLKLLPMNSRFERCFQVWRGDELTIDRCPGFNDDTLDILSEISGYEDCCHASRVRSLTILNCRNFSYQALKELVLRRKCMAPILDFVEEIEMLAVRGKVPRITKEELEWFEGNVPSVYMSDIKRLHTEKS